VTYVSFEIGTLHDLMMFGTFRHIGPQNETDFFPASMRTACSKSCCCWHA